MGYGSANTLQFVFTLGIGLRITIMTRMNFNSGRTCLYRGFDLGHIRIYEQGHPNPRIRQFDARVPHLLKIAHHIETAFCGQFFAPFRHQAHIFGLDATRKIDHLIGNSAFKIHAGFKQSAQELYIAVLYMAPVFAQMQGNGVRSR